jgi:hypothetical protein
VKLGVLTQNAALAGVAVIMRATAELGPVRREPSPLLVLSPSCSDAWAHPRLRKRRRILRPDHQVKERGGIAVTQDDLLYRFRPRVFAMAAELGNVRAACRAIGIHSSICYRWSGS